MPTLEIDYKDLCVLIDEKIPLQELEDMLPDIKCEVEEVEGDTITVEVTSDRVDLLSVEGIARNIASLRGLKKNYKIKQSDIVFYKEPVESRPYLATSYVKGVEMSGKLVAALMQFQEKLHGTFGRDRAKIAIGLHDADKVKGPFTYKEVGPREISFVPLGMSQKLNLEQILEKHPKGREYAGLVTKFKKYPVIFDSNNLVLSFPPVINGVLTEVTSKTKNILIDITGTSKEDVETTLNVLCTAFADRGATLKSVNIKEGKKTLTSPDFSRKTFSIEVSEVTELIGIELSLREISKHLEKMDYLTKEGNKNNLEVQPPFYRSDILHPVDIVEDIVMSIGLRNISPELPNLSTIGERHPQELFSDLLRDLFVGQGFVEVSNPILSSHKILNKMMNKEEECLEIRNPVSEQYSHLRNSLLPGMLEFLSKNRRESYPQNIFECGEIIVPHDKKAEMSETIKYLAGISIGVGIDFTSLKGKLCAIFEILGTEIKFNKFDRPYYLTGRAAKLLINKKEVGEIGEIHPQILSNFKLKLPTVACEVDVNELFVIIGR